MFRYLLIIITICCVGCSKSITPQMKFEDAPKFPQADYSQLDSWAAHPDKEDYADNAPPNVSPPAQDKAKADVFFIHPTSLYKADRWNADIKDKELNDDTESRVIKNQATPFNSSCRVFAPRYRQMTLGGFYNITKEQEKDKAQALMLAYDDVKKAFEHYLEHENNGRPIVIAGHSQGAFHGIRLVKEYFDGTELQKQLVAAYLPGWAFQPSKFEHIPVSQSPSQTGCIMGWATWQKGKFPDSYNTFYKNAVNTNPISWETNNEKVDKSEHKGFLMPNFKTIRSKKVSAQGNNGIIWINRPHPLFIKNDYHIGDINIFWLDIRENVELRVNTFTSSKAKAAGE